MNLNALAQVAQVLGGISVLVAVLFGIAQVRQHRQQRRDVAAIELMRSIQDSEFSRPFRLIHALPNGPEATDLRIRGPEYEDAAFVVSGRFETIGLLVFRRTIPYDLVEELIGGATIELWQKLLPWTEEYRANEQHKLFSEWFQWLTERFVERSRTKQIPAYERHRDWNPES